MLDGAGRWPSSSRTDCRASEASSQRSGQLECLPHRGQRLIEVSAEVIETDSLGQTRFEHHFHWLRLDGGKEDLDVIATQLLDCNLEGMQPARIHRRDVAHAEDDDAWFAAGSAQGRIEFLRGGKEERAFDAIKNHARRNLLAPDAVRAARMIFRLIGDEADVRDFFHLAEEQHHRHDQARADPDGKIKHDRQRESCDQDAKVGARAAPEFDEGVPLRHADGDGEKDGAERGERDVANEWSGEEKGRRAGRRRG